MKKIIIVLISLFILCGCSKANSFNKSYNLNNTKIMDITYEEFADALNEDNAFIFIGDDSLDSKKAAKIFDKYICDCNTKNIYFLKKDAQNEDQIKEKIDKTELYYPIIISIKDGGIANYYDNNTQTDDIDNYIYKMVTEVSGTTCDKAY